MNLNGGLCECGCGHPAPISRDSCASRGRVRGQPLRFIHNHNCAKSPVQYTEQDCGYETPCWVWQRRLSDDGYPRLGGNQEEGSAHRAFYIKHKGEIPEGMEIDHLCHVKACVNPDHLEAVTRTINRRRRRDTKLTWEIACEIRESNESHTVLARRYGVTVQAIYRVRKGLMWRLSPEEAAVAA